MRRKNEKLLAVGIAMGMTYQPKLLLADEPTSALDVTTQAQIVRQMVELKENYGMSKYANTTEYYLQSAAFDKECAGKTSAEINGMKDGTDALVAAGCTIAVSPLVAAVTKAIAAAK